MPEYLFKCPKCLIEVEQHFSIYSNHSIWCQPCQTQMEKQFTPPGIIFKGEGWAGKEK